MPYNWGGYYFPRDSPPFKGFPRETHLRESLLGYSRVSQGFPHDFPGQRMWVSQGYPSVFWGYPSVFPVDTIGFPWFSWHVTM